MAARRRRRAVWRLWRKGGQQVRRRTAWRRWRRGRGGGRVGSGGGKEEEGLAAVAARRRRKACWQWWRRGGGRGSGCATRRIRNRSKAQHHPPRSSSCNGSGQVQRYLSRYRHAIHQGAIEATYQGSDLVGKKYKPAFDYFASSEGSEEYFRILSDKYVTYDAGTGIVHQAPARAFWRWRR